MRRDRASRPRRLAARLPGLQRGGHLRYLRLYLGFLRFSISKALEFRVDFFFRVAMDGIYYAVNLAFFTVVYRHTTLLGGWDLDQVYIFVCGFLLLDAVHMTVFANNLWWLPIYINRGDLDYYLTRPVSSLFFLSLREFAANSFLNVLIAASLMVWALARYPGELPAARVALYLALLAAGTFLYYLIRMLFIIPVFWLHSNRGLDEVSWSLTKLVERPHQIYRDWLRISLLTVMPLALVASFPAQLLFEGASLPQVLYVAAVTAALAVGVRAFWRRGLAAYSSASS